GTILVHVTEKNFYVPYSKIWEKVDALMHQGGLAGVDDDLGASSAHHDLHREVTKLRSFAQQAKRSPAHEAAAHHVAMSSMADGLRQLADVADEQAAMAAGVAQGAPDPQ